MQTFAEAGYVSKATPSFWVGGQLAQLAVQALRDEVLLTPKPGLVDQRSGGSHHDMTLGLMLASAEALGPEFQAMAEAASGRSVSVALREELGALGREAETTMLRVTGGVNTHRGAIWALGLLAAGCAGVGTDGSIDDIVSFAAELAAMPDRFTGGVESHGAEARRRFNAGGAKQEACEGFPHVMGYGLPALWAARSDEASEDEARILSLLAIMARLDDTCLLYRAGPELLHRVKQMAARAYRLGGTRTRCGRVCMAELDRQLGSSWASPGGSADLLAATLFLDSYTSAGLRRFIPSEGATPCRN